MSRKPYLIRTPQFDPVSGGIRVMWGLYGWLLAKGEIAWVNAKIDTPSIGIYPEVYSGNDMGSQTVVRYILQTPAIMGTTDQTGVFSIGPTTEEIKQTSDHIYVFSRIYDTFGVDDSHILFLPIINLKIFKDQEKNRTKTCFLVGKGVNQQKHPADAIELTRDFAIDQQALSDLLNECHTLYCYDRLSAMGEIARLCGTKVRYYGNFSKEQLSLYEPGLNGFTYHDEKEVPLDIISFRDHYFSLINKFEEHLDYFIEETQK